MQNTTPSDLRAHLSAFIEQVAHQPIRILRRGQRECAVLVSPASYERAVLALGYTPYDAPPLSEDEI